MLETIKNILQSIADFIGSIVTGLSKIIDLIPIAVSYLTNGIGLMPSWLIAIATFTVMLTIIFIIIGREGGGN